MYVKKFLITQCVVPPLLCTFSRRTIPQTHHSRNSNILLQTPYPDNNTVTFSC
jgi:hypothetical protein